MKIGQQHVPGTFILPLCRVGAEEQVPIALEQSMNTQEYVVPDHIYSFNIIKEIIWNIIVRIYNEYEITPAGNQKDKIKQSFKTAATLILGQTVDVETTGYSIFNINNIDDRRQRYIARIDQIINYKNTIDDKWLYIGKLIANLIQIIPEKIFI